MCVPIGTPVPEQMYHICECKGRVQQTVIPHFFPFLSTFYLCLLDLKHTYYALCCLKILSLPAASQLTSCAALSHHSLLAALRFLAAQLEF